jgi:hypothetical protein
MSKKALDAIWVAVREAGGEEVIKDILRYTLKKGEQLARIYTGRGRPQSLANRNWRAANTSDVAKIFNTKVLRGIDDLEALPIPVRKLLDSNIEKARKVVSSDGKINLPAVIEGMKGTGRSLVPTEVPVPVNILSASRSNNPAIRSQAVRDFQNWVKTTSGLSRDTTLPWTMLSLAVGIVAESLISGGKKETTPPTTTTTSERKNEEDPIIYFGQTLWTDTDGVTAAGERFKKGEIQNRLRGEEMLKGWSLENETGRRLARQLIERDEGLLTQFYKLRESLSQTEGTSFDNLEKYKAIAEPQFGQKVFGLRRSQPEIERDSTYNRLREQEVAGNMGVVGIIQNDQGEVIGRYTDANEYLDAWNIQHKEKLDAALGDAGNLTQFTKDDPDRETSLREDVIKVVKDKITKKKKGGRVKPRKKVMKKMYAKGGSVRKPKRIK